MKATIKPTMINLLGMRCLRTSVYTAGAKIPGSNSRLAEFGVKVMREAGPNNYADPLFVAIDDRAIIVSLLRRQSIFMCVLRNQSHLSRDPWPAVVLRVSRFPRWATAAGIRRPAELPLSLQKYYCGLQFDCDKSLTPQAARRLQDC